MAAVERPPTRHSRKETAQWLKRRVAAWKAERGLNWRQIAEMMSSRDVTITPGSLMSKHSRGSFTAIELICLLQALEITSIELPTAKRGR